MSILYWAQNSLSKINIISGAQKAVNQLKGDEAGYSYKAIDLETSWLQCTASLSLWKNTMEHWLYVVNDSEYWSRKVFYDSNAFTLPGSHVPIHLHTKSNRKPTPNPIKWKWDLVREKDLVGKKKNKKLFFPFFLPETENSKWKESGERLLLLWSWWVGRTRQEEKNS